MKLLVNLVIATLAVLIAAYVLPGVKVLDLWTAIVVAVALGVVNAIIKPILLVLTLPVNVLSLGLFTFVINAALVLLVSAVVPGFFVAGFWWALGFSLVISILNAFLHQISQ